MIFGIHEDEVSSKPEWLDHVALGVHCVMVCLKRTYFEGYLNRKAKGRKGINHHGYPSL